MMDLIWNNSMMILVIIFVMNKGAYSPNVAHILSLEVQQCINQIGEYFGNMDVREHAIYAIENYVETDTLNPFAKDYYNLIADNLLKGDVQRADEFCRRKRFKTIIEKCRRLLKQHFSLSAVHSLNIAFYRLTSAKIKKINKKYVTYYWYSIIDNFGLDMGEGSMQDPIKYCAYIIKPQKVV